MNLREIARKPSFIRFTLWLARVLPRWFAYSLIRLGVKLIANRKPEVYLTVRGNMAHFPGMNGSAEQLDRLTNRIFINSGRFYYDHYRYVGRSVDEIKKAVDIPQAYLDYIFEATDRGQGVLLVGNHSGNFDLGAMAIATRGINIQLLSLAAPPEGFQLMNEFRTLVGLEVTPISPAALRKGIARLRNGGVVATAMDWPHPEEGAAVEVFGKPSYAPLGAARLALLSGARVMMVSFYRDPVEGYKAHNIPPVEMENTGDREKDIMANTKKIVNIFEELVVQNPDQWMMFHPFWPTSKEGGE